MPTANEKRGFACVSPLHLILRLQFYIHSKTFPSPRRAKRETGRSGYPKQSTMSALFVTRTLSVIRTAVQGDAVRQRKKMHRRRRGIAARGPENRAQDPGRSATGARPRRGQLRAYGRSFGILCRLFSGRCVTAERAGAYRRGAAGAIR